MKDRMKRLSILCLSVSLCTGNVYAEDRQVTTETGMEPAVYTADAERSVEPEIIQTETSVPETEAPVPETEAPAPETEAPVQETAGETETAEPENTEAPQPEETKSSETDGESKAENQKYTEKDTEKASETDETEVSGETEIEEDKDQLLAVDENGTELKKEKLDVPETLTVGSETYPVDYQQGVWKVTVPEGSRTLKITVPDQKEGEELSLTKWGGYLTESEKHWYLCPDDPLKDAYSAEGNTYTVDLAKFALSLEEITQEQLAVYGDLAEGTSYAEIFLTGEGRSELLLVEFEKEPEEETESDKQENASEEENTEIASESESETETETDTPDAAVTLAETEQSGKIATFSASASQVNKAYNAAGKNLSDSSKKVTPTVGSIGGEWEILGLARSGKLDQDVINKYLANVVSTLKENNGVLHEKRYTDYSRVILALTSLGVDVTNVGGYNLLKPLSDYDQTVWQGINGAIWALIAADSHDYEFPQADSGKTQNSREKLIQNILEQELSSGGWDLSNRSADPDITAMAIQSLAPYYSTDAQVKEAVDRGLKKLSSIQKSNGSFATYGSETSESCSQVIVALTALGINPNTDSRFVKNGKSVVDALLTYANADGSFKHVLSGGANQMATEQAY